jgi:hypothetical protein
MSTQTITAVYDTQAEAERAVEALAAQGIPRSDLRIHRDMPSEAAPAENQDKGFWASLADLFVPDDDRHTYAEALRRGSVMVTARVDDAHYEAAADLLETHGAVDLDERESSWRSEGWTGGRGIGQTRTGDGRQRRRHRHAHGHGHGRPASDERQRGIGQTRTSAVGSGRRHRHAHGHGHRRRQREWRPSEPQHGRADRLHQPGARPGGYTGAPMGTTSGPTSARRPASRRATRAARARC